MELSTISNQEAYNPEKLHESLLFGTPEQVVEKLRLYEENGVDVFCLGVNTGLTWAEKKRSLELFIERVMPHFNEEKRQPIAAAARA